MRLSSFSDFSFRVLMYAATKRDRLVTTAEVGDYFKISYNHLTKVVHKLSSAGYLTVRKGKGGGFQLGKDPEKITLGAVLREVEPDFFLVECHNEKENLCAVTPFCRLKGELSSALNDFLARLDRVTLADVVRENRTRW